jgi:D-glycero-D-manno-heptose 1,7-bisphosphate phosphatase
MHASRSERRLPVMSIKAIFLDKDGTLVDDLPRCTDLRKLRLCSGAGAALRLLAQLDYRFFVVSNQDGVALGTLKLTDLQAIEHRLADLLFRENLTLDGCYFCPHHPAGSVNGYAVECLCRKPMPGMLVQAARERHIDLASSWMLGDMLNDIEAGNRAGCRTVLVDTGNETQWKLGNYRLPTRVAPDLYAAAVMIASEEGVAR